jgi:hypothetical protein
MAPTAVWGGFVVGTVLLAYSYSIAARRPDADGLHFHLFWAGELVFLVPAFLHLLDRRTSTRSRLVIVVATALFDAVPKYLRDPSFPIFHDELFHSRQAEAVLTSGASFQSTPIIGIIKFFPGLHTLAASLAALTGTRLFVIEIALLVTFRILVLIGMFVLAERITGSAYVGSLAAFAYAANPSFLFFDAQFSYESLAIVLLVWTLAAVAALQAADSRRRVLGWSIFAVGAGLACVVTHHLSSYGLALALLAIAIASVASAVRGRSSWGSATASSAVAVVVAAGAVVWLLFIATNVFAYLAPHISGGFSEIARLINHEQQSRILFSKSTAPSYEQAAAFATPIVAFVAVLVVLVWGRRGTIRIPAGYGLVALGLLYFPSLPFIYTAAGNEGARRSWAYSYVGVSLLFALAVRVATSRAEAGRVGVALRIGCALAFIVLLVGNVGGDLNAWYRFPGPASSQSEARMSTPELRTAANWFRASEGDGRNVLTDGLTGPTFAFFGHAFPATPSRGFPTWQLFLSAQPPSKQLRLELAASDFDYAVVNRIVPAFRSAYVTGDLAGGVQGPRAAAGALAKFDRVHWSSKLYASDQVSIYRLDVTRLARLRQSGTRGRG